MQKQRALVIISSIAFALGLHCLESHAASLAEQEPENNGEDLTKPINRFDVRMQVDTLPDATQSGRVFNGLHTETLTLRSDLVLFTEPDQLALRFDMPLEWSNKPTAENKTGFTQFGTGDLLAQAIYVHTINTRWAAGAGLQMILPTASELALGSGKFQLAPTIGVRREFPEVNSGSYAGVALRQFNSVAGNSSRKNINFFEVQPQINLGLPDRWFLNTSPKLRYNFVTQQWFIPLDLMMGRKFGIHWVVSVEYQYGIVHYDDRYNEWLEARVGYFF